MAILRTEPQRAPVCTTKAGVGMQQGVHWSNVTGLPLMKVNFQAVILVVAEGLSQRGCDSGKWKERVAQGD